MEKIKLLIINMEGHNDIEFRAGGETPITEEELRKAEQMAKGEIPTNIEVRDLSDLSDPELAKQGIQLRKEEMSEGDIPPDSNIEVVEMPVEEDIEMGKGYISRESDDMTDTEMRKAA